MSKHLSAFSEEAADRLAIRELVEAYAHCADRRDAKGQISLLTQTPSQELHSREALAHVFADLQYEAMMHFVGQSTIDTLEGDHSTGEACCLAHHVAVEGDKRRLMIAALRSHDTFSKVDGEWLFAERLLCVDWPEQRALS